MFETEKENGKSNGLVLAFLILFVAADLFVWHRIIFAKAADEPRIYFLDVGQGDSELVVFPGNVKILTDAGPDSKILGELEKIPQLADRYIDLAVISHPQMDHFNGFRYLTDRYHIGAFIYNGRSGNSGLSEWTDLVDKIKQNNIPLIRLGAGDAIKYFGNGSTSSLQGRIDFLSPDRKFAQSAEPNDTSLVEMVESRGMKVLLTADIGVSVENYLARNFDLRADILKVAHHGSKYSSSKAFMEAVKPKIAVIEVGNRNNYGHPAPDTLRKLSALKAVFRTDKNGQITASVAGGKLKIFTKK